MISSGRLTATGVLAIALACLLPLPASAYVSATAQVDGVLDDDSSFDAISATAAVQGRGSAAASTDLRSGSIRLLAVGGGEYIDPLSGSLRYSTAYARGAFSDTIVLQGLPESDVSGSVIFHVRGSLLPSPLDGPSFASANLNATLTVGYRSFAAGPGQYAFLEDENFTFNAASAGTPSSTPTAELEVGLEIDRTFALPFTVSASRPAVLVSFGVWGQGVHLGAVDFGHTGFVTLDLPSGTTFTSLSGVFLTSPIPEPSTHLLLMLGLGGLVAYGARRRRAGRGSRGPDFVSSV